MDSRDMKVLVVEDDEETLNLYSRALAGGGYEVVWARSGADTLKLLTRSDAPIALMIVDVVLPGMSGPALVDEVRKIQPDVGAVYVSAYDIVEVKSHGVDPENVPFLPKPFDTDDLLRVVGEALGEGKPA
jgi:two-component system, cell cycle sensor histidine kinase and response regulator CckA